VHSPGMVLPGEWKEPHGREKVGSLEKIGILRGAEGASQRGKGWFLGNGGLPWEVD
jgi:hypothetical protein